MIRSFESVTDLELFTDLKTMEIRAELNIIGGRKFYRDPGTESIKRATLKTPAVSRFGGRGWGAEVRGQPPPPEMRRVRPGEPG